MNDDSMNSGVALGSLGLTVALIFAVLWGFGFDRFGALAVSATGISVLILGAGLLIQHRQS